MHSSKILNRLVYTSLLFSFAMILCRMIYSQQLYGSFLLWNLFLAWIPFALSILLQKGYCSNQWTFYSVFIAWLLFLPNAPYIITDLFHLKPRDPVPYWYDLILLFWAAWNGLLMGFISLMNVEIFLSKKYQPKLANVIINCCLVLSAFGVYAGRFLRWNSWDVVANPGEIISDVKFIAFNPQDNPKTWAVTLLFSILMIVGYKTLRHFPKTQ